MHVVTPWSESIRIAAELLQRDLAAYGIPFELRATKLSKFPRGWQVSLYFDLALAAEFEFFESESTLGSVAELAEVVQENVFETRLGSWPDCEDHNIPLTPAELEGAVWWGCPAGPSLVIALGELAPPLRHRSRA